MNEYEEKPIQPLELSPPVWIVLALIALLAMARLLGKGREIQSLVYVGRDDPVIVRSRDEAHSFPSLGIRIRPPQGWTYLSVTDDAIATQPTFISAQENVIVRIRQSSTAPWPSDVPVHKCQYGDTSAEWVDRPVLGLVMTLDSYGTELTYRWQEVDPRKYGRLVNGESELSLVALSHSRKPLSELLESFCGAIEWVQ